MFVHFLNPGSIDQISGGYLYNKFLLEQLKEEDFDLELFELHDLTDYLKQVERSQPDIIIIDSLLLFKFHNASLDLASKFQVIGLAHLLPGFISDEVNDIQKEAQIIAEIPLIVTSKSIKQKIKDRFSSINNIHVISPGVVSSSKKQDYSKWIRNLIVVSNFVPGKGILELLDVLVEFKSTNWNLEIYGNREFNPAYFIKVKEKIKRYELQEKITLKNCVPQPEIHRKMANKDLLIHNSLFESFGMCLHEAALIGLPILASRSGEYEQLENYPFAKFYATGNQDDLRQCLEAYFTKPNLFSLEELTNRDQYARPWENVSSTFKDYLKKQQ